MALNGGIIGQASNVGTETRAATVQEKVDMWKIETKIAEYSNDPQKARNILVSELREEGYLTEDEEIEINRSGNINREVKIGNRTISFLQREEAPIVQGPVIGDYINYNVEDGGAGSGGSYSITAAESGFGTNQNFNIGDYDGKWQIIYNDTTYGLQIVSSDNVLGVGNTLALKGRLGYNNCC